jgi:transposase
VTAEEDRIHLRQTQAIALRVKGYSFREIAKELGVSVGQAHHDVRAAMAEFDDQASADVELERKTQSKRLESALKSVSEVLAAEVYDADGNADHELKLKAIDRIVKLEERRAKLLGLDMPTKTEIDARVTNEASPTEAARLVREAFGSHALDGPDTGDAGSDGAGSVPASPSGS